MLPREDRLAAPHTPRPRYGLAAPRTSFNEVAAHRQVLNPRRRGRPAARGAFEPRCQARRLTRAWSWRRPAVRVEFHLCRTKLGAAAQARSVRRQHMEVPMRIQGLFLAGSVVVGVLLPQVASSQTTVVRASVRDSTGAPVLPSRIDLVGTTRFALGDSLGEWCYGGSRSAARR